MKRPILVLSLLVASTLNSQTVNFYSNVTNLWYQGHKSNVLEIAEQRLNVNTNDIAGLVLKLEYQIEFLDFSSFSNTMPRVLVVGKTVTSTNFSLVFPSYSESINILFNVIPNYPENEIPTDKQKALIPYKPLAIRARKLIEALQDDGYFQ